MEDSANIKLFRCGEDKYFTPEQIQALLDEYAAYYQRDADYIIRLENTIKQLLFEKYVRTSSGINLEVI